MLIHKPDSGHTLPVRPRNGAMVRGWADRDASIFLTLQEAGVRFKCGCRPVE